MQRYCRDRLTCIHPDQIGVSDLGAERLPVFAEEWQFAGQPLLLKDKKQEPAGKESATQS